MMISSRTERGRQASGRPAGLGLRERDLALLWEGGRLPSGALVTLEGVPLQIVYRGRPNAGAGPDFRDAVIALPDGRLLHGDIELHLRASDFRHHGHQRDPAYRRVILHLVFLADDGRETSLAGGGRAPVVALERWLTARSGALQAMLEQPALWREPCQSAVERLGSEAVQETLARLGERRLCAMVTPASSQREGAFLYHALLRTLGHGREQAAWLRLADRVPVKLLESIAVSEGKDSIAALEAVLLGAAGFLGAAGETRSRFAAPLADAPPPAARECRTALRRLWACYGSPESTPIGGAGPFRPANHPARRLAGLARLVAGGLPLLLARLHAALHDDISPPRALLASLTVPADGLWQQRLLPWVETDRVKTDRVKTDRVETDRQESASPRPQPALIGAAKARELALNAALPLLLAQAERDGSAVRRHAVLGAYHALPAPPAYGCIAHLARALQSDGKPLICRAAHSQGALYLFANYCTQGGCGRCPLS